MYKLIGIVTLIFCCIAGNSQTNLKILFDATKAESSGNGDWVIDADQHNLGWHPSGAVGSGSESNAQKTPTASQSGITASTAETFWTGALSNWAIDCVKRGYKVETLPYNGQITYGSTTNTQDLSKYKVFVVDEPNILFTASQKIAILHFIQNGGGLFIISDHDISDRNNDGHDSPEIWNDLITNNTIANNSFGFTFDLQNISQTSSNISAPADDSIIHGPMGTVTEVLWANGTTMTLDPVANPSVKGVIYTMGTGPGNSNVMCAYSRLGSGKIAAMGDSSPADDGTGDPNDQLYNGYTADANGNHQKLIMNMTIWLADTSSPSPTLLHQQVAKSFSIFPNPCSGTFKLDLASEPRNVQLEIYDLRGKLLYTETLHQQNNSIAVADLQTGMYVIEIKTPGQPGLRKKLIIEY